MKNILIPIILLFLSGQPISAKHLYVEKDYQKAWCSANSGMQEYVLPDQTRVDCLLKDYAIEFDFGKKWAEAVGQSLYYAYMTGKQPGIVLILETSEDEVYIKRVMTLAPIYNIKVWSMTPAEIK